MKSSSDKPLSERPEKALLRDLANMRDDGIAGFRQKAMWKRLYATITDEELLTRRDELRRLWKPRFSTIDELLESLERRVPVDKDRSARLQEFAANNYPSEPIEKVICEHWLSLAKDPWIVKWDKQKALRANPRSLPAVLALSCIRHVDHFGFCRNPGCLAPYFFARRKDQRYCSVDCAGPAKREAKLRWWHQNKGGKP